MPDGRPFVTVNTVGFGKSVADPLRMHPVEVSPVDPFTESEPGVEPVALVYLPGIAPVMLQPRAESLQLTAAVPSVTEPVILVPVSV